MKYIIEYINESKQISIIARQFENNEFTLTESSNLDGYPIEKHVSQPRALKENGKPDLELFIFTLKNKNDKKYFKPGQEVELLE